MAVAMRLPEAQLNRPVRPRLRPSDLASVCLSLERRLVRGEEHIRAARANGEDVARLEAHWRDLLHSYERLSRLLASAPAQR